MPRFTANISFLFTERPFLERFQAARDAGFEAVECHFPYEFPVEQIRKTLAQAGLRLTGINTAGGDRAIGEWGFAGVPGQEARFARDFDEAVGYATALGTPMIHVMAGVVPPEARASARQIYVANLRAAAEKARAHGLTLLLEPLNVRDTPFYLVAHCDELADIIAEIAAPNVKLLFDVYHIQIMDGDLTERIAHYRDIIGHVQIAGVPSRAEPDEDSEVNYAAIFKTLDAIGYAGLVGAEYRPRGLTENGLGWLKRYAPA